MSEAITQADLKEQEILAPLNEQQRLPVIDFESPSIIIAGAGSGKTATLVARTLNMINRGVDPHNILLFTFTRKGADEIRSRIIAKAGDAGKAITMGTYHSFCARFLRRHIEVMGPWTRYFSILDADDSLKIVKKLLKNYKADTKYIDPRHVAANISRWKEKMMSPTVAQQSDLSSNIMKISAQIYQQYSKELRSFNAMDFDDLIYYTIRILEQYPEIKAEINERYHYITADESQDSSPRDLELIYHLGGYRKHICLIGDDWQSIYGFRGSDINTFFYFVKEYGLKRFELSRNYRSTQNVVNAASSVVKHNVNQFNKEVFSKNSAGAPVVCYAMDTSKQEAARVVQVIKTMHNKQGIAYKDMAILYRMSFLSRNVEDAFITNSIPYQMLSGTPFYARKEIKDLIAYLKFVLNPNDQVAMTRAINIPKRGIGETSLNKITTCIYGLGYDILTLDNIKKNYLDNKFFGLKGKAKLGFDNFFEIVSYIDEIKYELKPSEVLMELVKLTGYFKYLKEEDEETFDDRKRNINELCSIANSYSSLDEFVGNMIINEAEVEEEQTDKVNMLTIHGSKGGEWKVVILIGCEQGIIPSFKATSEAEVEEERRLMYVAMTRAKEYLFLTRAKKRMQMGAWKPQQPSIFLKEIDKQYIRQL